MRLQQQTARDDREDERARQPRDVEPAGVRLLQLQRTVGNRATVRLLQARRQWVMRAEGGRRKAPAPGFKVTGTRLGTSERVEQVSPEIVVADREDAKGRWIVAVLEGTKPVQIEVTKEECARLRAEGESAELPLAKATPNRKPLEDAGWLKPGSAPVYEQAPMVHGPFGSKGVPDPVDISQGMIGDCFLIASLESLARHHPKRLMSAIEPADAPSLVYRITMFDASSRPAKPVSVLVTAWLPSADGKPAFALGQRWKDPADVQAPAIWPALFEKAYAQLKGGWETIAAGDRATGDKFTNQDEAFLTAMGVTPSALKGSSDLDAKSGMPVLHLRPGAKGAFATKDKEGYVPLNCESKLIGHQYSLARYDDGGVEVWDPRMDRRKPDWNVKVPYPSSRAWDDPTRRDVSGPADFFHGLTLGAHVTNSEWKHPVLFNWDDFERLFYKVTFVKKA